MQKGYLIPLLHLNLKYHNLFLLLLKGSIVCFFQYIVKSKVVYYYLNVDYQNIKIHIVDSRKKYKRTLRGINSKPIM